MSGEPKHPSALVGDTALVFDASEWMPTGDVGDNSQFWKPCRLLRVYRKHIFHGEWLATVRWPDGRVTDGHIVSMMRQNAPSSSSSAS